MKEKRLKLYDYASIEYLKEAIAALGAEELAKVLYANLSLEDRIKFFKAWRRQQAD